MCLAFPFAGGSSAKSTYSLVMILSTSFLDRDGSPVPKYTAIWPGPLVGGTWFTPAGRLPPHRPRLTAAALLTTAGGSSSTGSSLMAGSSRGSGRFPNWIPARGEYGVKLALMLGPCSGPPA